MSLKDEFEQMLEDLFSDESRTFRKITFQEVPDGWDIDDDTSVPLKLRFEGDEAYIEDVNGTRDNHHPEDVMAQVLYEVGLI